jgi:FkbM family methyltransferase
MNKTRLKQFLHRAHLYPWARHCYRLLHGPSRRDRRVTRDFYRQFVQPGDLCFDIGANVGQTTEALTALNARVIAVEPNPMCLPALKWQFGRNRNVTIVEKALGAVPGVATLHFEGTASTASLRTDWPFEANSSRTVELTTLDALIAEFGRPKLCKVDVEGFEVEVFKGLNQPIPLVYFEMHKGELDRARSVLAKLASLGAACTAKVTTGGNDEWIFDRWLGLDELSQKLDEIPVLSNAVVRMDA